MIFDTIIPTGLICHDNYFNYISPFTPYLIAGYDVKN